ncbi:MAG: insulinase family protein [Clostridia bacterium]|nr:insulinase family protein [Clostridia bacterium]
MPQINVLADGVRLVAEPTDRFKTACISVSMALPMDEHMAANALLLYLLKRSCRAYPDMTQLQGKLDALYGASIGADISKIGEAQVLRLQLTCLADKFALTKESIAAESAQLLADLIFRPNVKNASFGAAALQAEKRLLIQRVEEELNDKRTYAYEQLIANMCQNELYGKPKYGTVEEIEAVKMSDVYAAWRNLLRTAIFQITVVGAADAAQIAEAFAAGFKRIERAPVTPPTQFVQRARRFNHYSKSFPVNQGKLVIGFRAGMADSLDHIASMTVMNDLFGGGTYSKLFANVREKMSLAYYCWSRLVASKGLLIVESGIDTEMERKASAEILSQLSDLRNSKTDPALLDASKRSLRERLTPASPYAILEWYSAQVLQPEICTQEARIAAIEEVTMEDVCAAAKRISIDSIYMLSAEKTEEAKA